MNEEETLKKRFEELARRSYERGIFENTGFLTPQEQNLFLSVKAQLPPVNARLYSPSPAGIRKIAVFGSEEELGYAWEDPVKVIHIAPRSEKFGEELTHRDYLGSVLALGINRDLTGDIIIRQNHAWIFALYSIVPFICENLLQVRHTPVFCTEAKEDVPELAPRFEVIHENISSERSDLLIACIAGCSRENAKKLIAQEKVFVNGRLLLSVSHRLNEGDEIVVRGFGKYIYDGITSRTRKDRLNISLRKYI